MRDKIAAYFRAGYPPLYVLIPEKGRVAESAAALPNSLFENLTGGFMKIPCPECRGTGWKHTYGSGYTMDACPECDGKGKIDFIEKPQSHRQPAVCSYCGQQDCASMSGASLCGPQ